MPPILTVAKGPEKGREFILDHSLQVGRDEDCDVVLSDAKASRHHALFETRGEAVELVDLDSRNGTRVNGKLVDRRALSDGDVIKIGGVLFQFSLRRYVPQTNRAESIGGPPPVTFDTLKIIEGTIRDLETLTGGYAGKHLAMLYRSGHILGDLRSPSEIMERTLDLILEALPGADHASIHLLDDKDGDLVCVSARHTGAPAANMELPYSRSFLEMALHDKQALLVSDVLSDARFDTQSSIRRLNLQAAMCAPLHSRNTLLGLLHVTTARGGPALAETDLQWLAGIGLQAGAALSQARLIENLEREKAALQHTRDLLAEVEKMAAIGRLAAGVVHDVKTPLAVINGFSEMLRKSLSKVPMESAKQEECSGYMDHLDQGVEQCMAVISNLLDFAQPGQSVAQPTKPDHLMQECLNLLKAELGRKGIHVEKHFEDDLPELSLDPVQMKRVFVNLIMNALQAMESRGRLLVTMCREQLDTGPMLAMRISDNGCGMADDVRRKVFEPFFSGRKPESADTSTGLGLSVCYNIVQAHGGHIEVESTEGIGTTFTVYVPEYSLPAGEITLAEP